MGWQLPCFVRLNPCLWLSQRVPWAELDPRPLVELAGLRRSSSPQCRSWLPSIEQASACHVVPKKGILLLSRQERSLEAIPGDGEGPVSPFLLEERDFYEGYSVGISNLMKPDLRPCEAFEPKSDSNQCKSAASFSTSALSWRRVVIIVFRVKPEPFTIWTIGDATRTPGQRRCLTISIGI